MNQKEKSLEWATAMGMEKNPMEALLEEAKCLEKWKEH